MNTGNEKTGKQEAPFAALFDLDGVLMDTEGEYTTFWTEVDRLYPTGVKDFATVIKGSTLDKIFKQYFPDRELQERIYQMLLDMELHFNYRPFPDTMTFVRGLQSHGVRCVVVTSSNIRKMGEVYRQLPAFKEMLPELICDEDVSKSKPDPEGYIKGAALAGKPIEECIVFEDSFSGLEAGRRSGAKVVALATTRRAEDLKGKADLVAGSLSELNYDILLGLFGV